MKLSRLTIAAVSAVAITAGTIVPAAAQDVPWITMEMTGFTEDGKCVYGPAKIEEAGVVAFKDKFTGQANSAMTATLADLAITQEELDRWVATGEGDKEIYAKVDKVTKGQYTYDTVDLLKKMHPFAKGDINAYRDYLVNGARPGVLNLDGFEIDPAKMRVNRDFLRNAERIANNPIADFINTRDVRRHLTIVKRDMGNAASKSLYPIMDPCADKASGSSALGRISSDFSSNFNEIRKEQEKEPKGERNTLLTKLFGSLFGYDGVIVAFFKTILRTLTSLSSTPDIKGSS